jgi:GntP family gluconate:H+ symporter
LMDPLWILAAGIVVVVGGVLVFKLHAFLALISGALVVAALTPQATLQEYADKQITTNNWTTKQANAFLHKTSVGERVGEAFGSTCGKIGILIGLASIVGKCLLDSGGADRIVRSTLRLLGEERAPLAFLSSGFLLGIPVFFDTVFYLMIPLGKAMRVRTGRNYLLYVLTITAGATMTHSLVPPTPGPLFVANELGVDLGLMILGGCIVGAFTSAVGYFYAVWANRRWDISPKELTQVAQPEEHELPPTWLSLLPIVLPVVLICATTVLPAHYRNVPGKPAPEEWQARVALVVDSLGSSNVALMISAVVALLTLAWYRRSSRTELADAVQSALTSGGEIILVTASGGAFGGVLQQTMIAGRIEELAPSTQSLMLIPMAFLVTTAIRTAQGSATVAMITAAGILRPLAFTGDLPFHPMYLALAIGCGSKPFTWMNDSGFWVISRMSGLTEGETLKAVTPLTAIMGFSGLIIIVLGAWMFPLI